MFTLAHELTHIWLGKDGLFNLVNTLPANEESEKFCNEVAAEFLVPADKVEEARLRSLPRRAGGSRRLACQTRLLRGGNLTVRKPGVRLRLVEASPPSTP